MKRIIKFKTKDKNRIPYCENPAIGMGAPECSEDCYKFGGCNKDAYFRYIHKNYKITPTETTCPHVLGLYTCHICGNKVETAYFDDNENTICKECKDKKEKNKLTEMCNINIEGKSYSIEEIMEILKKHKKEEDAKYINCDRCGIKYLENTQYNMVCEQLDKEVEPDMVIGYQSTPYINGIQILSTCGNGRKLKLCDKCVGKFIIWLNDWKNDN